MGDVVVARFILGVLAFLPYFAVAAEPPGPVQPSIPPGVNFAPRVDYPTSAGPFAVAVADVHRAGKLDIVVGSAKSGKIGILPGRGDGTFLTRRDYAAFLPSEFNAFGFAVNDANLDGKPDVLFQSVGQTGLLRNRGDGTFQQAVHFDVRAVLETGYPLEVFSIGDINRDGKIDIVTGGGELGLQIQFGDGRGSFTEGTSIAATDEGGFPASAIVTELNRDGIPDLLVASFGPEPFAVRARLGRPDGTFRDGGKLPGGGAPVTADFNFDARTDVAQADFSSNSVLVSLGRGDGTFLPAKSFATGAGPRAVAVGDVNRDGKSDMVVADSSNNSVSVLLGQGNGVFVARRVFAVGRQPSAIRIADVNADGFADLVVTSYVDDVVSVLLGKAP